MDELTGWAEGLRDDVEEFFGGIQGGISYDTDDGLSGGVAFGERRVLSWQALILAALAGAVIMAVLR